MKANDILDAIEHAYGDHYLVIRETGMLCDIAPEGGRGRMDAVLVPWSMKADCMVKLTKEYFWDRPRLIGIEVKVSRSDFLKGLREGQYRRYDKNVSGLFLAVPRPDHPVKKFRDMERVCKLSEVPKGVGLLTIRRGWPHGIVHCARRPQVSDAEYSPDVPWRILFDARTKLWTERSGARKAERRTNERIGQIVARAIANLRVTIRKAEAK